MPAETIVHPFLTAINKLKSYHHYKDKSQHKMQF